MGSGPTANGDQDGVIARPGLMMAGTPLLGAKYFQEIAPPDAVDRGQIEEMGLSWPEEDPEFSGCIKIFDTNPAKGECSDDDEKIYCPGVGLVQDQELELVLYGFVVMTTMTMMMMMMMMMMMTIIRDGGGVEDRITGVFRSW